MHKPFMEGGQVLAFSVILKVILTSFERDFRPRNAQPPALNTLKYLYADEAKRDTLLTLM